MRRLALLLFLAAPLFAQGLRFDSTALTTTGSVPPPGSYPPALIVPGSTVFLCTTAACNVAATSYTDQTLATACPANAQITFPGSPLCAATTNSRGQFGFWVAAGTYYYRVTLPTGNTYGPYPITLLNPGYVLDTTISSLTSGCTAAGATGTLAITRKWLAQLTQTLSCHIVFYSPGSIQPASGQTVTLNPDFTCGAYQQCFDVHLGGSIAFTGTPPVINPNWYGADWTGTNDSSAAVNAFPSAVPVAVEFQPGTYKLASATLGIRPNDCVLGPAFGTAILNATGSFPAVTITNAANSCLKNISIESAQDGILISTSNALIPSSNVTIRDVNVLAFGNGYAGVHVTNTACCNYWDQFDNVNINSNSAAPAVGTRTGWLFDSSGGGSAEYNLRPVIIGGRVTNVLYGFKMGAEFGFVYGVELDGMTNGSGGGIGIWAPTLSAVNQFNVRMEIDDGSIDKYVQLDSGSANNSITVLANDFSISGYTDAGLNNCMYGGNGSQGVSPYCNYPQVYTQVVTIKGTGGQLLMPGGNNGQLVAGGTAATSTQLGGVNAVNTFGAPNSNFGYAGAAISDSVGRSWLWTSRDWDGSANGTHCLMSTPLGSSSSTYPSMTCANVGSTGAPLEFPYGTVAGNGTGSQYSSLPSWPNGATIYCSDCKNVVDNSATAGAACAGSGSGALARRENGRWDCN